MINIKHKRTGAVLRSFNANTLSGANLCEADLRGADLREAIGNGREINTIICDNYIATWNEDTLAIGCQQHTIDEWICFSDKAISQIGNLRLWEKWKPILITLIKGKS